MEMSRFEYPDHHYMRAILTLARIRTILARHRKKPLSAKMKTQLRSQLAMVECQLSRTGADSMPMMVELKEHLGLVSQMPVVRQKCLHVEQNAPQVRKVAVS